MYEGLRHSIITCGMRHEVFGANDSSVRKRTYLGMLLVVDAGLQIDREREREKGREGGRILFTLSFPWKARDITPTSL